jgi:nucleotide-binding universal stress UspA family protein
MKVLLAMDTSAASQAALEQVLVRPWPAGTSFEILSVVEPAHLWAISEVAEEVHRRATETVQRAAERLRSAGWQSVATVSSGDPKAVILDRAESTGADFIVVGSHGVSALTRFLLGNVAAAVLRYAKCSVEVVRVKAGKEAGPTKILLATDGSEYSHLAARSIAERQFPAGTEVRILSAVELVLPPGRALLEPPFVDAGLMETLRADAMKHAQEAIASTTEMLSASGLTVSEAISVLLANPKTIILDEAAKWGAGLIVLGSHGRRGVERFMLGSVSEAVAVHAECSVDVIRKRPGS